MQSVSLKNLFEKALQSLRRFPFTLLFTVIGVSTTLYLIQHNIEPEDDLEKLNLIITSVLGLSVFFSIHMLTEKMKASIGLKSLLAGAGLLFLGGVYFTLPLKRDEVGSQPVYLRLFVFFVCAHLLAAFIPFIKNKNLNGFWQYNRKLFIRFLTSALFSAVIFAGLSLALLAIHQLFDVRIDVKRYPEMWVVVAGIFNTWMFLSGVPRHFEALDADIDYPKGLRIFAQYVLLPLLVLYLLILYAYGAKIILLWNWPKGIISYLVICVAAVGSLTFLFLYPYGESEEHQWIKKAGRIFYLLMLPLLILLFIAISMRLSDYGITMHRYIIFMMGLWLSAVSLYTISGRANIRFIPMSLTAFLLISIIGPWSMFSVSERSQVNRLEKMLTQHGILKERKIVNENLLPSGKTNTTDNLDGMKNSLKLNDSLQTEVSSILDYLSNINRLESINPWFSQNMDSLKRKLNRYEISDLYMQAMGLQYNGGEMEDSTAEAVNSLQIHPEKAMVALPVSGYDVVYPIDEDDYSEQTEGMLIGSFRFDGQNYRLTYSGTDHAGINFSNNSDTTTFYLDSLVNEQQLNNQEKKPTQEQMTFSLSGKTIDAKLIVTELYVDKKVSATHQNIYQIKTMKGWLLLKKK